MIQKLGDPSQDECVAPTLGKRQCEDFKLMYYVLVCASVFVPVCFFFTKPLK